MLIYICRQLLLGKGKLHEITMPHHLWLTSYTYAKMVGPTWTPCV